MLREEVTLQRACHTIEKDLNDNCHILEAFTIEYRKRLV